MRNLRPLAVLAGVVVLTRLAPFAAAGTLPRELDPLVQDRDTTISPRVDFFRYADGGWFQQHPIPASEIGWGIGNQVEEETYRQRRDICMEAAASGAGRGTLAQKIGDFWAAGMDTARIDREGAEPLAPWLRAIAAVRSRDALLDSIATLQRYGIGALYTLTVGPDERNSDREMIHLAQGGLGMPDRGYYFDADSSTRQVRRAYREHLTAMFRLLGEPPARARVSAAAVYRIEVELARHSRTLEGRHDPWANYHPFSIGALSRTTPSIDWSRHLAAMGITGVDSVIVRQPEFFTAADSLLAAIPLSDWKSYLKWNLVNNLAARMSRAIEFEDFRFYGTALFGAQTLRPRWKRVIDAEESAIGDLLGQEWVRRYCPPTARQRYDRLTDDIIAAYRERIRALPWMSDVTKQRALVKLDHVTRKVAYPDRWRDYSALQLDRESWVGDQMRVNAWWFRWNADRLGKPIDRTIWDMTPQSYNAYYSRSQVEIVLPAAVFMLPGIPDSLVDDAILYAYAGGSTIGHELTHGLDDAGRQFDEHGNLNPWWTDQDSVRFSERARKLEDQYDAYQVGTLHLRGKATLGENIADLGGLVLAYEAFQKTEQWKRGAAINGLTPDQRFFLAWAMSWMNQLRPAGLTAQVMSSVHSPSPYRVIGPLTNLPEFDRAFGIQPGDPMYRPADARVRIW